MTWGNHYVRRAQTRCSCVSSVSVSSQHVPSICRAASGQRLDAHSLTLQLMPVAENTEAVHRVTALASTLEMFKQTLQFNKGSPRGKAGATRQSHVQCTICGPRHDQHMLTSLHTITSCANSTNVSIFECHILMHKSSMVMCFSKKEK